jgi:hypothetical protein
VFALECCGDRRFSVARKLRFRHEVAFASECRPLPNDSRHREGAPKAGEKATDVYNLCSVLYELALGHPPLDPSLPMAHPIKRIASGQREALPRGVLPAGLAAAVTAGVSVDPSKRATLAEVIRACQDVNWNMFTGADALKVTQLVVALPVGAGVSHPEGG